MHGARNNDWLKWLNECGNQRGHQAVAREGGKVSGQRGQTAWAYCLLGEEVSEAGRAHQTSQGRKQTPAVHHSRNGTNYERRFRQ